MFGQTETDFGHRHQAGVECEHVQVRSLGSSEHVDQLGGGQMVAGRPVQVVVVEALQATAVIPHHQCVVVGGSLVDRPVDEVGQCLRVSSVEFTEQLELGCDHRGIGIGGDEGPSGITPGRL